MTTPAQQLIEQSRGKTVLETTVHEWMFREALAVALECFGVIGPECSPDIGGDAKGELAREAEDKINEICKQGLEG